ncbi:MAG: PDZ domain-containing protein [Planctomycetes bacterium]|nr:PDZ domain-containing protein [Planctomycetota bacterium]
MRGVDLNLFRFDYDLTFAVLLLNADGTLYHVYGGRDALSSSGRLSMESLIRALRGALGDHAEYMKHPTPPPVRPARVVEDTAAWKRRAARKAPQCVHCHNVNDWEREELQAAGRWTREWIWKWPLPERVGLVLDRDDPEAVREVTADSAAARAGLAAGDRLTAVAGRRVRTQGDVQWGLEEAPWGPAEVAVRFARGGEERAAKLALAAGWKDGGAAALAWRSLMWGLTPAPGFGGGALDAQEKAALGLDAQAFAMRVSYFADSGAQREQGRAARAAGIAKGDVVLAVDGVAAFASQREFQAWFRLTRAPGATVAFEVLRGKERVTVRMKLME